MKESHRLSGVIVIQNYQVILYQQIGFSNVMSLVLTGIWGTVGMTSAALSALFFDSLGRRKTMVRIYPTVDAGMLLT